MTENKEETLKIVIEGYEASITEEATKLVREKLVQLKLKFGGPQPFPTHCLTITVPSSPHKHKDAQEKYERNTHQRKFFVPISDKFTPSTLENLLRTEIPGEVNLRIVLPSDKKKKLKKDNLRV